MFVYDPTISTGNILTIVAILGTASMFLIRQSYSAGKYAQEFTQVHRDLEEIKTTLKEQDRASREKLKADSLADGVILVLQQRVLTLETEVARARENIHNIANTLQVELARRDG